MFKAFKKNKSNQNIELFSPASGKIMKMEEVNDPIFSQKMMGDGFAVYPKGGIVTSPVEGEIVSIFPTKHAIGIKTVYGEEVIIHIGINTVELEGKPFELFVSAGDKVNTFTKLVHIDLAYLEERGIDPSVIVVFTNLSENRNLDIYDLDIVNNEELVGRISV